MEKLRFKGPVIRSYDYAVTKNILGYCKRKGEIVISNAPTKRRRFWQFRSRRRPRAAARGAQPRGPPGKGCRTREGHPWGPPGVARSLVAPRI